MISEALTGEAETTEGSVIGSPTAQRPGPAGPPPASGAHLLIEGREPIALTDQQLRIGRGMSADVTIDESTVSRRHALVVRRGSRTLVLDDRSLNGVFLNGRRVTEAELSDGDVIVLGRVVIHYRER